VFVSLEAAKDNSAVRRLLEDEQGVLHKLAQQLATLGPKDRKMIVDAMLAGNKMDVFSFDAAEGGLAWRVDTKKLRPSVKVIRKLIEAGKLDALKNQFSNSAGHRRVRPL